MIDPLSGRHFAAKVLPYRSVDNYISGSVVTFTDLTAVHQAETALRKSEERLRALLAASSQSIYRMTPDWSEMIDMSSQPSAADAQNSTQWLTQHVPLEEQPRVGAAIDAAIREKRTFELEHRIFRPDGSIGWTMSRAVPITDAAGEIVEWFGAAGDITARREAQEAMRESEERLKSLVEGLTQLVWRADDAGRWTWAGRQWADYTGQSATASKDWGWLDALHPDDRPVARAAWRHAAAQGVCEVEYRIRRVVDGTYRWFQTRAKPVRDDAGAIAEWIGTSTDVDDLRGLQERQGVLVAELQHRTRNLISVVRQVAHKTASTSGSVEEFRVRFGDRLDALARVQGLLSRLKEQDRVVFDDLIQTELAAHGADAGHDDRVRLEGPAGIRLRSTTVQALAMALHELATNAVKYGALGQAGARLVIRWWVEGEEEGQPWLHIDWRETGVLVPPRTGSGEGGQGRELIERALPYQLAARTSYELEDDGVHCTIAMPVSATKAESNERDG